MNTIKEIDGVFQRVSEKTHSGRLYSKELIEKAYGTMEPTKPPEPEKSIYQIFKMPTNENDRRHKEKQIAKRRHDKRMKKLQRQKKK
jgi:hypothetical protein